MARFITREWIIRLFCVVVVSALTFPLSDVLSDVLHIDHLNPNIRTNFFSPRSSQSEDITLVGIRDEDLKTLPYIQPVDRQYLADLVSRVAMYNPRVIVIDFLFDHPTEPAKEAALSRLLRDLDVPVVMAYGDDRAVLLDRGYQNAFLNEVSRPYGYSSLLKSSGDDPTSFVVTHIPATLDGRCSLAQLAADPSCKTGDSVARPIEWRRSKDGKPVFASKSPKDVAAIPASDSQRLKSLDCKAGAIELPRLEDIPAAAAAAAFTCRIVVIGGAFSFQDVHPTPLVRVVDRHFDGSALGDLPITNDMAGIEIQAMAIQQRLDEKRQNGKLLTDFSLPVVVALVICAASLGTCLTLFPAIARRHGLILVVGALIFMAVDILLYVYGQMLFPGGKVAFAFGVAFLVTYRVLHAINLQFKDAANAVLEIIT